MQVLVVSLLAAASVAGAVVISVTHDADTGFSVHESVVDGWIVRANFSDEQESTGWARLEVDGRPATPSDDPLVAFAAGLAEAHLTSKLIDDFYYNALTPLCEKEPARCIAVNEYLTRNLAWTRERVLSDGGRDPFWRQVGLIISQLDGLQQGISEKLPNADNLTAVWLTTHPEAADLMMALPVKSGGEQAAGVQARGSKSDDTSDHCSVLVKITEDRSDLLVGHATWIDYNYMIRMLKRYNLPFSVSDEEGAETVPAASIAFSGFPGGLSSMDDFALTSAGLVVTETTLDQHNKDLWDFISSRNSVPTWVRATAANRLGTTGQEWHNTFSKHNSGTYNNQWMVVDYKKFVPASEGPAPGLLWVTEQMPGLVVGDDVSQVLIHDSYWASYNQPYFPIIDDISGNKQVRELKGSFYSYANNPRAKIFRRDHTLAVDAVSALRLMRYNNFTEDPLSACNCSTGYTADSAIASRRDLNDPDGEYSLKRFGFMAYGAIDAKVTSLPMMESLQFAAEAGPTHDQQPVFQWSTSPFDKTQRHRGQPDRWEFDPILVQWGW